MPKQNKFKLFFATLIIATGVLNLNFVLANNIINNDLVAKKSGGRSGGGSFKSRPSRSSSPKRKSSPRRSNYNQRKSNSPSYRKKPSRTYRDNQPTLIYQNRSITYNNYGRSRNFGLGSLLFLFLSLFLIGLIIYLIYQTLSKSSNSGSRAERKINRERDNDRVTVSMLQVALSSAAENIQQELSALSLNTDTDMESGLVELMQESALILLRNNHAWTHVLSSSNSLDINQAESAFDKLSIKERSKFSSETLSNVDGTLKSKAATSFDSDDFASYVVVTLILGTADDKPLFTKINTESDLSEAILQLSSMRNDYLIKFELLWTPQKANQYLSDDELLMEYTNIMPLA